MGLVEGSENASVEKNPGLSKGFYFQMAWT